MIYKLHDHKLLLLSTLLMISSIAYAQPQISLWKVDSVHLADHNEGEAWFFPCGGEYYLDYTGQEGGTWTDIIFDIKNMGDEALNLTLVQLSGDSPAEFSIVRQPTKTVLQPQEEDHVIVRYTFPEIYVEEDEYARLQIISNDPMSALCEALLDIGCGDDPTCPTDVLAIEQSDGSVEISYNFDTNENGPNRIDYTLTNGSNSFSGQSNSIDVSFSTGIVSFNIPASEIAMVGGLVNTMITLTRIIVNSPCAADVTCSVIASIAVLPVELLGFKASAKKDYIELDWATASEYENSHFEIERSENGKNFKSIAVVQGQGTVLDQTEYIYRDMEAVSNSLHYYRLKQVDFDGRFEYSGIKTTQRNDNTLKTKVFPNPVSGAETLNVFTYLEFPNTLFFIKDIVGNVVRTYQTNSSVGWNTIEISIDNLPTGTYFIVNEGKTFSRFIKTNR